MVMTAITGCYGEKSPSYMANNGREIFFKN